MPRELLGLLAGLESPDCSGVGDKDAGKTDGCQDFLHSSSGLDGDRSLLRRRPNLGRLIRSVRDIILVCGVVDLVCLGLDPRRFCVRPDGFYAG